MEEGGDADIDADADSSSEKANWVESIGRELSGSSKK
jgi:hypothetical protein